jgi:glycosyltransferase involved in cell wall biosynthesis
MPTISTIIPAYNRAHSVRRAIDSVLSQAVDLEVIVVDDGSTDNTREVVNGYEDPRVVYIRQGNAGAGAARAAGAKRARGRWLHFLDSDDYVCEQAYPKLLALAESGPSLAMAFCECWFEDYHTGKRTPAVDLPQGPREELARFAISNGQFYNCRFLVKRIVYEEEGGYDPDLRTGVEELVAFLPVVMKHAYKRTNERLAVVRLGDSGRLTSDPVGLYRAWGAVMARLMRDDQLRPVIERSMWRARSSQLLLCGTLLFSLADYPKAVAYIAHAVARSPGLLLRRNANPLSLTLRAIYRMAMTGSV